MHAILSKAAPVVVRAASGQPLLLAVMVGGVLVATGLWMGASLVMLCLRPTYEALT